MQPAQGVLGDLAILWGALLLVLSVWMLFTVGNGLARRRVNFLVFSIQLFGLLFLVRDVAVPLGRDEFGMVWPGGTREALSSMLVVAAAFVFDRLWRHFVWDGVMIADGSPPLPRLLRGAFTALVMLAALSLVVGWIYGQSITAIVAASGVVAVVLGYAAQSVLSDLFGGLALAMAPSFKIGDVLEIEGAWVTVVDQNWRYTEFLGRDGRRTFVPNSKLVGMTHANLTARGDLLRQEFSFEVDPATPPVLIEEVFAEVLASSRLLPPEGEHDISTAGHGSYGLKVSLRYFARHEDYVAARMEVANLLWYALHARGTNFSFNRNHVYSTDWDRAVHLHPSSLLDRGDDAGLFVEAARAAPELAGLDDGAHKRLHARAEHRIVAPRAPITIAGEESDSVFLLAVGKLDVLIPLDEGREDRVAEITAPALVGFMSLALHQPRSATLRAAGPASVYEISGPDFAAFMAEDPAARENIVATAARLAMDNERARESHALSAVEEESRMARLKKTLTSRFAALLETAA